MYKVIIRQMIYSLLDILMLWFSVELKSGDLPQIVRKEEREKREHRFFFFLLL